jgi:hypothetical protein
VLKQDSQTILEVIAAALERMAFVSIEPVEGHPPLPADPILIRVPLWLPQKAAVEMIAPRSFGTLIAANAMAVGPERTISPRESEDALSELLNILASAMLLSSVETVSANQIVKGVPEVTLLKNDDSWNDFIADERTVLFSGDGHIVACRLTGNR